MNLIKFKNGLKLFLANILIFLGIAFLIELGGQIYAYIHPAYAILPFEPHPILGWRFIPNSEHMLTGNHWYAREFSTRVKINSQGFRDLERSIDKNQDTVRIALLGDSMVAGREVSLEKTASQLLEKKLNEKLGQKTGINFEVLNFGVPGYGIDQIYQNWNLYASKYDPDYVFVYIFQRNYLRTISPVWCQKGFLGLGDLKKGECLSIRPFTSVRRTNVEYVPKHLVENIRLEARYINLEDLKMFNYFIKNGNTIAFKQLLELLSLKVRPIFQYKEFLIKQAVFLNQEMEGQRILKKERKIFIRDLYFNLKSKLSDLVKKEQKRYNWKKYIYYLSGDKDNFPSWTTTNVVNLKVLQHLGEYFQGKHERLVIVDSFQFHNPSIPPTLFASYWLKNLSHFFHFGYIPLFEMLNDSRERGIPPKWKYDGHLNEIGQKIFADSLYQYLEQKLK